MIVKDGYETLKKEVFALVQQELSKKCYSKTFYKCKMLDLDRIIDGRRRLESINLLK